MMGIDPLNLKKRHMFEEKTFDTGSVKLTYVDIKKDAPPMLMLHGLSGCWRENESFLRQCTEHWHVYTFDLRGHGTSDRGSDYQLTDYAGDVAAFIEGVIGESVLLVGHSLGGAIALQTTATYPQWIKALVALDPPLVAREERPHSNEVNPWFAWVHEVTTAKKSVAEILEELRKTSPEASEAELQETAERVASVDPGTVEYALDKVMWTNESVDQILRNIQSPLFLLYANWEKGAAMRPLDAEFLRERIPSAITKQMDTGHLIQMEKPVEVAEEVRKFWQSL